MGWFCLVPWLSSNSLLSKTKKMTNPKPNILDMFLYGKRKDKGNDTVMTLELW